jgi:hypothetical protein
MARSGRAVPAISIQFGAEEWREEVERYGASATGRLQAQRARREIEAGVAKLSWKRCRAEDAPDGTSLPGCVKLYLPLDRQGASNAPFGFVFQLDKEVDGTLVLSFLAFGERHPDNPSTRSVYERAHKRLHGRYP